MVGGKTTDGGPEKRIKLHLFKGWEQNRIFSLIVSLSWGAIYKTASLLLSCHCFLHLVYVKNSQTCVLLCFLYLGHGKSLTKSKVLHKPFIFSLDARLLYQCRCSVAAPVPKGCFVNKKIDRRWFKCPYFGMHFCQKGSASTNFNAAVLASKSSLQHTRKKKECTLL